MAGPQDYAATAAATAAANKAAAAKAKASTPAKPKLTAAETKAINTANAMIAKNKATIAQLEALQNPAPTQPAPLNGQAVLAKFTSGQTLTDEEKKYLGLSVTPTGGGTGGGTGGSGDGNNPPGGGGNDVPTGPSQETKDAFATMGLLLQQWGLEGLADTYGRLMTQGLSAGEALTKLKYDKSVDPVTGKPWNAAYTTRFAGNAARVAAGMNAYDEATYLDVENAYEETLRKYGLNNMLSTDKKTNQAKFATYMANGIAPTEFAERIQTVADRVINMDPSIKAQFQTYYPSLTNTDLVSYFLDPKETLPVLKNKVASAEIGAAAGAAGYGIGEARAMDLAKFGVTREQALAGYQNVAEVTPASDKLSKIYNEEGITYGQTQAEDEFLKQDAQAKLKRNRLASKERAAFQGQSGTGASSFDRAPNF